jgi:hypothetical protein
MYGGEVTVRMGGGGHRRVRGGMGVGGGGGPLATWEGSGTRFMAPLRSS